MRQSLSASELSDLLTPKPLDEVNKDIISDKDLSKLLLNREAHEVCVCVCVCVCARARCTCVHVSVCMHSHFLGCVCIGQAVERDGQGWQYLASKEA